MSCEAEKELKLVGAKLTDIAGALMSRDEDPGELTLMQLLSIIESKLKDRGPVVTELYTRSIFVRRRLEGVLTAARNVYELAPSQEGGIKELGEALGQCDAQAFEMLPEGGVMIMTERVRQILVEGRTAEHDDKHDIGQLCSAAGAYLFAGDCLANAARYDSRYCCTPESLTLEVLDGCALPFSWPWDRGSYRVDADPVRNLVKAGALIAAEIDRLLRLKATEADAATDGKEGN